RGWTGLTARLKSCPFKADFECCPFFLRVAVNVPGEAPLWQLPHLMATTLAPVDSREVVRCDHCLLVQFRTSNDLCRRCHASLDDEEPEVVMAPPPQLVPPAHRGHLNLASSIRA